MNLYEFKFILVTFTRKQELEEDEFTFDYIVFPFYGLKAMKRRKVVESTN